MEKSAKIYVADSDGLVGSAILAELKQKGYEHLLPALNGGPRLADARDLEAFFARTTPEYVFLIGGKSGGIGANQSRPADLMRDNLLTACHVIESSQRYGVRKLLYLASSCVYPKFSSQPMRVEYLMTDRLEPTNESYAVAKLAGLYLCQAYRRQFNQKLIAAIPSNVFGPGDDFSLDDSHVIGALMRRMHGAKLRGEPHVAVWGSGSPRREFIFSHDLADACLFIMDSYDGDEPINVGVGCDWSIWELAQMIRDVVGYTGQLTFDRTKPDGMPAKLLDSSDLREMGWQPRTEIRAGLAQTYEWFLQQQSITGGEMRAGTIL
jgi:GDP-L-fucose synthase